MGPKQDDYAAVLEGADFVTTALAKNLLEEAGVPCLIHGQDSFAELGYAPMPLGDVLVPRPWLARAQALLDEAWGAARRPSDSGSA